MRNIVNPEWNLLHKVKNLDLDPFARDPLQKTLGSLRYIYLDLDLREKVFVILSDMLPVRDASEDKINPNMGRPGMEQWRILVLGVVRLVLNLSYDQLLAYANQNNLLRKMLGHDDPADAPGFKYKLQTIKDNVSLLTPEHVNKINELVVKAGHNVVGTSPDKIDGSIDSFVVETNVEYPTDTALLFVAMSTCIHNCAILGKLFGIGQWRQWKHLIDQINRLYRKAVRAKHSTSNDETKRAEKQEKTLAAFECYVERVVELLERVCDTHKELQVLLNRKPELRRRVVAGRLIQTRFTKLGEFIGHAERQLDQVNRRIFKGETIPHEEKVFSLFKPDTQWVVKGKIGVPVELGVPLAIIKDQFGFILTHHVMRNETDSGIFKNLIKQAVKMFGKLRSMSADKGFHSPANQAMLKEYVSLPVVPKKGKLNAQERARQSAPEFVRLRRKHSAVESAINSLQVHGLGLCRDYDIDRYIALGILANNLYRLGVILDRQEIKRKRGPYKKAA
jgi:hypothetical protein